MTKTIQTTLKKLAVKAVFLIACLLLTGCKKDKEPLTVYGINDTYYFKGARLNQQGDTLQQYSLQLSVPENKDSTKTFNVGLNTDGGVSHNVTWELTDEQTGETYTSKKRVAKSDRKVTLNVPDAGPMAFTGKMLPLVADLDMGKKSFVQIAVASQEAKQTSSEEQLLVYKATLTYPGDTVVFLPDSLRVVCKNFNAVSESAKQNITSKFLFNKDMGFVRFEYLLPENEKLVFRLVPPFPAVKTKEPVEKK